MAPVVPWNMRSIVRAISVQTGSRQKHKVLSSSELEDKGLIHLPQQTPSAHVSKLIAEICPTHLHGTEGKSKLQAIYRCTMINLAIQCLYDKEL